MNRKILTIALIGLITLGTTTGIFAAANAESNVTASETEVTMQSATDETMPAADPTIVPTAEPTIEPTIVPTVEPTIVPTVEPTIVPTVEPTIAPATEPAVVPTVETTVTPIDVDADKDDDKDVPIDPSSVSITEEAAEKIALNFAGTEVLFIKIELQSENGVVIYEMKVKTATTLIELKIDANTGVVLSSSIYDCTDKNSKCDYDKFSNGNKYGWYKNDHKNNESCKNDEAFSDIEDRKNDDTCKDKNQAKLEYDSDYNCQYESR